jgi:hypothetical protein
MKSFNQFLQESYLSEEIPTGMSRDEYNRLPADSRRRLSGSDAGLGRSGQTLTRQQTPLAVRGARKPVDTSQSWSHRNPGKLPIPNPPKPPTSTPPSGGKPPTSTPPSGGKPPTSTPPSGPGGGPGGGGPGGGGPGGGGPGGGGPGGGGGGGPKPPTGPKLKVPAGAKKALRIGGKLLGPAAAALDVADERSKGSGWLRSLAKGAVVAAGGAAGGAAGTAAGPVGTFAGATGGAMAASKAFDVAAGANAVERKAIATANRKGQAGGAIKGIGGKTTFDTKKNTITTGTGAQRKTAQLGKTSVITGPGGKQEVGNLAYKGGKAVYKRSDTKSLAQTSSNPLERIGRSLFAGAYKKSDAANAAKKLATARQSDAARNKALGVKFGPGK